MSWLLVDFFKNTKLQKLKYESLQYGIPGKQFKVYGHLAFDTLNKSESYYKQYSAAAVHSKARIILLVDLQTLLL